ncbi:MAG: DNA polymerase III subunit delta [Clostridia bacterium]|nr:DNA polymerase III subunit delta [Clostridia bacterium]
MAEKKVVPGVDYIKEEIKNGLSGVYFFYGDEDYMKQYYLHEVEKAVVGDRTSLNFIRLTGDEFTPGALEEALGAAVMYDFMSLPDADAENEGAQRLVELYEVDFKALKPSDFTSSCKLLKEKLESDTVVIIYSTAGELPEDSKPHQNIIKELSKVSKPVRFPLESDSKLCSWLVRIAAKNKVTVYSDVAGLVIERVGHSMLMLRNEIEKLISYVLASGRNEITRDDIMKITASNKEISPFDFANALMRRDAKTAFYILADMKDRGEEPIMILSTVSRVVGELIRVRGCMDAGMTRAEAASRCGMHEYKVKLYMEQLKNISTSGLFAIAESAKSADLMLKSSPVDSFTVLERLICELVSVN